MKIYLRHPGTGLIVSSDGEVFVPKNYSKPAHWTYGTKHHRGYLCVKFNKKWHFVHRLVSETFITNPENKPCVDHINRNKMDNRVENLRWSTYSENSKNTKAYDLTESTGITHWCDDATKYAADRRKKLGIRHLTFSDGKQHAVTRENLPSLLPLRPSERHWPLPQDL